MSGKAIEVCYPPSEDVAKAELHVLTYSSKYSVEGIRCSIMNLW